MVEESKLEIIHCWRTEGERKALDALLDLYRSTNPHITIIDDALGNIAEVKTAVKSRITREQPPDTFQNTFGPGAMEFWAPYLEPVNELFENLPIPQTLKEWGKIGSYYYSMPLNLHRDNNLWYNRRLTDELDVAMPLRTVDDFLEACKKIKRQGYIPFAFGTKGQAYWLNWIFEWFIISLTGNGAYLRNFYLGKAHPATDQVIKKALVLFQELWKEHINPNWDALTWNEAGDMLRNDEAVFNIMGDWQKGHFIASGWEPWEDFGFQTAPQTDGVSIIHGNCFGLTKGAPHPKATFKFLKILRTIEAQQKFCEIKSASPPRSDCPLQGFDPMQKAIIKLIRSDGLVPNVLGSKDFWINKTGEIFEALCRTTDLSTTLETLDIAYEEAFLRSGGATLS